ncbi:MAG: ABC transporter permease, partial [Candidatus Acidiferrales bacterium]
MGMVWQNLRYGVRVLLKSPGFTLVTILTLALGIGANTAIFSVVYTSLLRPLPYRQPEQLVTIGEARQQSAKFGTQSSYPDFLDWRKSAKSYESLAGFAFDGFMMSAGGDPKLVPGAQVTPNFFSTLAVKPLLGRDFIEGEDKADGPHVALLAYGFWSSEFGADPSIVGRSIRLDDQSVTVVGVLPRNFEFAPANSAPVWVPMHRGVDQETRRSLRWMSTIGRLAPGVSLSAARAEMLGVNSQMAREHPKENSSTFIVMGTLRESIVGQIRPLLLVLFGAVGFVLLIACANVASLLMTRSISRRKEFAVRAALGASRGSLISQMLAESLLLSICGAAVGLLGADWDVSLLIAAIPEAQLRAMPFLRDAAMNFPVLVFLCAATVITGILFGLAPGLAVTRAQVGSLLNDESRGGTSATHTRLRNAFVIAEIAISLVLLTGAGLMLQSLRALLHRDPGFDPRNVLTFSVNLPDASYPGQKEYPFNNPSAFRFERQFTAKLRDLPGVRGAASVSGIPLSGNGGTIRFVVEGRLTVTGQEDECDIRGAGDGYFPAMKIPLVAGRFFDNGADTPQTPSVVVVNQTFVKSYFANENPIGKRIRFTFNAQEPFRQIVGVVGDVTQDDLASPAPAVIYAAISQNPSSFMNYVVRTAGDPAAFVGSVQAALREMDSQLSLIRPQTIEQIANQSPSVFLRRYP